MSYLEHSFGRGVGLPERVVHGGLMDKRVLELEKGERRFRIRAEGALEGITTVAGWVCDLVSGPLNGVLYHRGERLESAEWDLLFWGISLGSKGKTDVQRV